MNVLQQQWLIVFFPVFLALLLALPISVQSESPPAPVQVVSIDVVIKDAARRHHIDYNRFYNTLKHESDNFRDVAIQSNYIRRDGTREKSFGICQINLPSHPNITYEQAIDPVFCTEWSANEWEHGRAREWSAYNALYAN